MSANVLPFAIVLILAVLLFAWSCFRRFRLIALGRPDNRFNAVGKRLEC